MSPKSKRIVQAFARSVERIQLWGAPLPALSLSKGLADFARRGKLTAAALALAAAIPLVIRAETTAALSEQLPAGPMQQKATTACTECHEARIILQQRLSKPAWTKEVDKMTKWGALVDAADRDALIEYLSENFSPDKPPYVPPRSSREKSSKSTAR